jgi:hypothetical protein
MQRLNKLWALSIPIVERGSERIYDRDFRYPDDPLWTIRINQWHPEGMTKQIMCEVKVAGVTFEGKSERIVLFILGKNRQIILEREPNNPYGPNTIKVLGLWVDNYSERQLSHLGYIPHDDAAFIAENSLGVKIGATIYAMFLPHEDASSPGLRLDIWRERNDNDRKGHHS